MFQIIFNFAPTINKTTFMKTTLFTTRALFLMTIILVAAAVRLLPHLPNFTPIAAIALFGGAMFNNRIFAFVVPLLAMLLSDAIIGFHNAMIAVYSCFTLTVVLGLMIKNKQNIFTIFITSVIASLLFFLVTNYAAWIGNPMYPQGFSGLMVSYFAGLPFFRNEFFGDLFYNTILFGGFYVAQLKFPVLIKQSLLK